MRMGSRRNHDLSYIFLGVTMLASAMLGCTLSGKANGTTSPSQPGGSSGGTCLAGILPGKTTREEVVALLGEPVAVETDGSLETLLYASSIYGQFNSVVIQDNLVRLVSAASSVDDPPAWSAIKKQYGEPAHTTYSNYQQGSMTYIYPDWGLAFIASQAPDLVYIQECFIPITLDEYMNTWGKLLPIEDPFIR